MDTIPVRGSMGAGSARPTARMSLTEPPSDSIMSPSRIARRSSSASCRWSSASGSELCGHDRAGGVGDRDVQLARAEVHAGDESELAGERDERRAAAAARGERGVQESGCRQLLDDVRHRRGRESGAAGQLDLSQPPMPFERLDEPGSVGFTK